MIFAMSQIIDSNLTQGFYFCISISCVLNPLVYLTNKLDKKIIDLFLKI